MVNFTRFFCFPRLRFEQVSRLAFTNVDGLSTEIHVPRLMLAQVLVQMLVQVLAPEGYGLVRSNNDEAMSSRLAGLDWLVLM